MSHSKRYAARGVSSTKDEVHVAIEKLDKGLYPNAFCKILPDIGTGDTDFCTILHADTAGTKASLAYVYWRETGDLSVWKGISQDAIVMNLDDMACVGCVDDFLISNTITRNKHKIPGEVLTAIIDGAVEFCDLMASLGITIHHAGGETADVGDIVRTVDVGFTAFGRMRRDQLVINDIKEGDVIIGLASYGQSTYETEYNSGIGSNGLTSARHDVLTKKYAEAYPESYGPETPEAFVYSGTKRVEDEMAIGSLKLPVGKLLLSPTRTFVPVVREVFSQLGGRVNGIIHCTGGGQTKVSKFLPDHLMAVKNNLLPVPPLFTLIQEESKADWQEMYQVFNMGVRLELYLPREYADTVLGIASHFAIDAQIIGQVESSKEHAVVVASPFGTFHYE